MLWKPSFAGASPFEVFNYIPKSFNINSFMRWRSTLRKAVAVTNISAADEECSSICEGGKSTETLSGTEFQLLLCANGSSIFSSIRHLDRDERSVLSLCEISILCDAPLQCQITRSFCKMYVLTSLTLDSFKAELIEPSNPLQRATLVWTKLINFWGV